MEHWRKHPTRDWWVSDHGRVVTRWGCGYGTAYGEYLSVGKDKVGVHRAVLETFVGPCPQGMEACHRNGNGRDNRLSNLRWGTRKSNAEDRGRHGTQCRGETNGRAKLSEARVQMIRTLVQNGMTQKDVSCRLGVPRTTVNHIMIGRTWSHVK